MKTRRLWRLGALLVGGLCACASGDPPEISVQWDQQRGALELSSQLTLPGESSPWPQLRHSVIADPAGYLLLWQELEGGGTARAYAARIAVDGTPVDATPTLLAAGLNPDTPTEAIQLSSGGTKVALECPGMLNRLCALNLSNGVGSSPAPVANISSDYGFVLGASQDAVVLVFAQGGQPLRSQTLLGDGGVGVVGGTPIATSTSDVLIPSLACETTGCVVCWYDTANAASALFCERLDAQGGAVSAPTEVTGTPSGNSRTSVALSPAGGLMAWEDGRAGAPDVYLSGVDGNGQLKQPNGVPLAAATGHQRFPELRADGLSFWATWEDVPTGTVVVAPVSEAGAVDGGVSFPGVRPRLAFSAPGQGIVVYLEDAGTQDRLRARLLGPVPVTAPPDAGLGADAGGAADSDAGVNGDGGGGTMQPALGGGLEVDDPLDTARLGVGCGCGSVDGGAMVACWALVAVLRLRRARQE